MTESFDLIKSLRDAAVGADPLEGSLFLYAASEIERCHHRLEIDRVWRLSNDGSKVEAIPYIERLGFPDGIESRDATIRELRKARQEALIYAAEMAEKFGDDSAAEAVALGDKGAYANERREIEEEMYGLAEYLRNKARKT